MSYRTQDTRTLCLFNHSLWGHLGISQHREGKVTKSVLLKHQIQLPVTQRSNWKLLGETSEKKTQTKKSHYRWKVKEDEDRRYKLWNLGRGGSVVLCQLIFIDHIRHLASNQSPSLPPSAIYPFILLSSAPSICITTFDLSLLGRKRKRLTSALNTHTHTHAHTHTHTHTHAYMIFSVLQLGVHVYTSRFR